MENKNKIAILLFNYFCNLGLIVFVALMLTNLIKTFVTNSQHLIFYKFIILIIFSKLSLIEYRNKITELDITLGKKIKNKSKFNLILGFLNFFINIIIIISLTCIGILLLNFYVQNKLYYNFLLFILMINNGKYLLISIIKLFKIWDSKNK